MAVVVKTCSKCQVDKPLGEFYKDKSRVDGYAYQCKTCQNVHQKEYLKRQPRTAYNHQYYISNQETINSAARMSWLKKYGITPAEYAEMLFLQDGTCKICKQPPKGDRRLCVDHDHDTGKVRGLLCNTCNAGLGQFGDSVELLERAIEYLKKGT